MPYKNKEDAVQNKKTYYERTKIIRYKKNRYYDWTKKFNMRFYNFDKTYEEYMNTKYCELCDIELTDNKKINTMKSLDHDHKSGYPRNICCHKCNAKRGSVDRRFMFVLLELHRYFNLR